MKMHILMGCSGSGKSTFAKKVESNDTGRPLILSADDYVWEGNTFLPHKIAKAHGCVFAAAIQFIQNEQLRAVEECCDMIIDNTNTTLVEIAPYVLLCQAYGVEPMFHLFGQSLSVEECFQRVQERGYHPVPKKVIYRQALNLQETLANWPLFWPQSPFWNNDRNP